MSGVKIGYIKTYEGGKEASYRLRGGGGGTNHQQW